MNANDIYSKLWKNPWQPFNDEWTDDDNDPHITYQVTSGNCRLFNLDNRYMDHPEAYQIAISSAVNNTWLKSINPESVEDMRNALLKCLSYLADLNGSQWIDGDGAGEIDMRQRAKGLQQLAFDTLEKSKL